ncbi:hypothetical protein GCM10023321_00080 [Pseudonocardia eucalypti]|uniref:Uncharacterized protein n=1 Tax=Pseudonocardia eucalypti TaxID=648755 RepID=A0ABP9PCI3_9PSEU
MLTTVTHRLDRATAPTGGSRPDAGLKIGLGEPARLLFPAGCRPFRLRVAYWALSSLFAERKLSPINSATRPDPACARHT